MRALFTSLVILIATLSAFGAPRDTRSLFATRDSLDAAYPPIGCGKPCVISFNPGGAIDLFEAEARELVAERTPVIVDGPCISACTILVDIARNYVCVTSHAVLGYHQWSMGDEHGDVTFSTPGLNAYIKAHGGEPTPDSGRLLMMNFSEARHFYKPCQGAV